MSLDYCGRALGTRQRLLGSSPPATFGSTLGRIGQRLPRVYCPWQQSELQWACVSFSGLLLPPAFWCRLASLAAGCVATIASPLYSIVGMKRVQSICCGMNRTQQLPKGLHRGLPRQPYCQPGTAPRPRALRRQIESTSDKRITCESKLRLMCHLGYPVARSNSQLALCIRRLERCTCCQGLLQVSAVVAN